MHPTLSIVVRLAGTVSLLATLAACENPSPTPTGHDAAREAGSAGSAATSQSAPATASASASASADGPAAREPMNVLLITIDSLRADMPWQGYKKKIAPNLTRLAEQSVVYENAYTVSSYTAKSVGAMLSGRYPSTLYRGSTFFTQYSLANVFFPELLQKAKVRTMAGHAHLYFDRGKNLRQGFDVWKLTPGITWNATTDESVTSQIHTPMAIDMLSAEATKGRFFMWLHYMDPHDKYVPHKESPHFGRRARDLYNGEVYYTDLHVQKLLDYCAKQPWYERTAVIISSDHGEAFGEHKMYKHAFALWEVLTRVPLMFKIPGAKPQRITERRSQIDLAPTIMDLLGETPAPNFAGRSMVPELMGLEKAGNREPILLDLPADSYNPPTRAMILGDYKLLEDPGPKYKLFNLSKDPGEKRNLAGTSKHRDKLKEMRAAFDKAWAPHAYVAPYGGRKLVGGKKANGPHGPPGYTPPPKKKKKKAKAKK